MSRVTRSMSHTGIGFVGTWVYKVTSGHSVVRSPRNHLSTFLISKLSLLSTSARKKCALGEAAVRPDVKNQLGTPHTPSASGEWLHGTADARCVWIPGAWDCGRLVRSDTGCMATGCPLLSERGFS